MGLQPRSYLLTPNMTSRTYFRVEYHCYRGLCWADYVALLTIEYPICKPLLQVPFPVLTCQREDCHVNKRNTKQNGGDSSEPSTSHKGYGRRSYVPRNIYLERSIDQVGCGIYNSTTHNDRSEFVDLIITLTHDDRVYS